jgi:hypothetical protein
MVEMKPALATLSLSLVVLASCTTIQNRRDLYFPQTVNGPYTRMLKDGSWRKNKSADDNKSSQSLTSGSSSRDSKSVKPLLAE